MGDRDNGLVALVATSSITPSLSRVQIVWRSGGPAPRDAASALREFENPLQASPSAKALFRRWRSSHHSAQPIGAGVRITPAGAVIVKRAPKKHSSARRPRRGGSDVASATRDPVRSQSEIS